MLSGTLLPSYEEHDTHNCLAHWGTGPSYCRVTLLATLHDAPSDEGSCSSSKDCAASSAKGCSSNLSTLFTSLKSPLSAAWIAFWAIQFLNTYLHAHRSGPYYPMRTPKGSLLHLVPSGRESGTRQEQQIGATEGILSLAWLTLG